MSLPPILSNLPIFKIFARQDGAKPSKAQEQDSPARTNPRDIIDISPEGLKKFSDVESRPVKSSEAQTLARATRDILAKTEIALGLDPAFQE